MAIVNSCCCWRSLRRGCYAAAIYTVVYYLMTMATMGHFIYVEHRYLSGEMEDPESESFLEPEKITPITVGLNISLLACSSIGLISCGLLVIGVYKDLMYLLLPWVTLMSIETAVEIVNLGYLIYLQAANFNPVTSFLFTMDFFIYILNGYALVCVISQYQEYKAGRGTAAYDNIDMFPTVQFTVTAPQQTTTSATVAAIPTARRRSIARPSPSRIDPDEFSEAPPKIITSVLAKPSRSGVKKHVQFPDEQSCMEEACEIPARDEEEKPDTRVISSLWMDMESESEVPER